MLAAGISAEEIKIRGRWASDVYEIYCRLCQSRLLDISRKMSNVNTDVYIGRGEGFFDMAAGTAHDGDAGAGQGDGGPRREDDGYDTNMAEGEDPYSDDEIMDDDDGDSDFEP